MKIGIILHSQTGNTNSVALKLQEKLIAAGHAVDLERLKIAGEWKPGIEDIRFESLPDLGPYDALVLGSPVQAFSLSPVMKKYLAQIPSFQGKRVAFLVTQHFAYPWLGGNRAVRRLKRDCQAKGAAIRGSEIINWSSSRREQQIVDAVERLGGAF